MTATAAVAPKRDRIARRRHDTEPCHVGVGSFTLTHADDGRVTVGRDHRYTFAGRRLSRARRSHSGRFVETPIRGCSTSRCQDHPSADRVRTAPQPGQRVGVISLCSSLASSLASSDRLSRGPRKRLVQRVRGDATVGASSYRRQPFRRKFHTLSAEVLVTYYERATYGRSP